MDLRTRFVDHTRDIQQASILAFLYLLHPKRLILHLEIALRQAVTFACLAVGAANRG